MTSSPLRLFLYACFLMALGGISASAQTTLIASFSSSDFVPVTSSEETLPDSPGALQAAPTASRTFPLPSLQQNQDATSGMVAPGQTPCDVQTTRRAAMTPEQLKAEESQYTAGVLPNFNTVINRGGCVPRLTARQKWELVYKSSTAPFTIGLDAVLAGYDEIDGSHNGYGWGPAGYFKRFGAQYADTVSGAVIGNAILPILLKQDPRYFQLGPGHPVVKRVWHAALSTVICKGDNGKSQFSYSNVIGNFLSGALSNAYYPADERGIGLTLSSALTVTAEGAFGAQLLEFSTEISKVTHHLLHGKSKDVPPAQASSQASPSGTVPSPAVPPAKP